MSRATCQEQRVTFFTCNLTLRYVERDSFHMAQSKGEWLTRNMERRDISARQVAQVLGVTTKTVYDWLSGKTAVSEERVPRLAEILGVSELEARRGLGYWVPAEGARAPEFDAEELRETLNRFRKAADDLERLINREASPPDPQ